MLVIPTVSIGNVPQFALDLLIHTYNFDLVEHLDSSNVVPFIGPRDYTTESLPGISTAIEVYKLGDLKIVQIRSPPLNKEINSLCGSSADGNHSVLVIGSANAGFDKIKVEYKEFKDFIDQEYPDSGYFNDTVTKFKADSLISWIYEGDNTYDAVNLAVEIVNKLGLPKRDLVAPVSWSGVYGKEPPLNYEDGIYT